MKETTSPSTTPRILPDAVVFHLSADAQSAARQRLGRSANGVLMAEPEAFWHARLTPSRRLRMDLVATLTGRLRACIHI